MRLNDVGEVIISRSLPLQDPGGLNVVVSCAVLGVPHGTEELFTKRMVSDSFFATTALKLNTGTHIKSPSHLCLLHYTGCFLKWSLLFLIGSILGSAC